MKEQIEAGNFQDAFMTALGASNIGVTEFCCENVELEEVFHGEEGCVVTQTVLVCLMQQLGSSIAAGGKGGKGIFDMEAEWLQEIVLCIDPSDKDIGSHVKGVKAQLIKLISSTVEGLAAGKEKRKLNGLLQMVRGLAA